MTPYYEQDGIVIYHGDCREVLDGIPAASIGLVCSDPPFGIGFERYESHNDEQGEYEALIRHFVYHANRVLHDGGACFVWQGMLNASEWTRWFPRGFRLFAAARNFTQFMPTSLQYSWDPVVFWYRGKPATEAIAGVRDWHIGNTAKYVAEKSNGHPCPRPLDTVEYIISNTTLPNWTVLDPFVGSGTALVAAKRLGRRAIGIEIEERYCEIAVRRLAQGSLFAEAEQQPLTGDLLAVNAEARDAE